MKKILLNFAGLSDPALEVRADAIITGCTGNPNIPDPSPELTAATAAATAYSTALAVSKTGTRAEIEIKNQKKEELVQALVLLANYVTQVAKGDVAIMLSAGFEVAKQKQPQPPIEKPEIISALGTGNSGELELTIRRIKSARLYMYEFTQEPLTANSMWQGQSSTLSKHLINGMESGKRYWCRVVAYGTNNQAMTSDPVARVIQ